ncbi:MAG: hypothetical protein CME70_18705 [Halobacteriovorax sp.]|nr:hypothetical protein [Halobacteriovorax sp.]|tara:strand:- start:1268 stop:2671 length:1404 start_codon:yes stop_codon:yes gene_type:complete
MTLENYSELIAYNDSTSTIVDYIGELKKDLKLLAASKLGYVSNDRYVAFSAIDIKKIIINRHCSDSIRLTVRNILLESLIDYEKAAPGSSIVNCITFLYVLEEVLKLKAFNHRLDLNEFEDIISELSRFSRITTINNSRKILENYISNPIISKIIFTAARLSGHNGQIYLDPLSKDDTVIETYRGYRVPVTPLREFWVPTKVSRWKRSNVKCFVIDGILESVSEVHHILSTLSETKEPGVIFCRGCSEEVTATLGLNFKRQSLDIIPVVIPYDLFGSNLLKDIAVICGTDVVSSLKGELISSINIDEIVTVPRVDIDESTVVIQNENTYRNVQKHIAQLSEQKKESHVLEKSRLIDDRIKVLTSICTRVSFGHDYNDILPLTLERAGTGIGILSTVNRSGIIHIPDLKKMTGSIFVTKILNDIMNELQGLGFIDMPALSLVHGIMGGFYAASSINNTGAFLVLDQET